MFVTFGGLQATFRIYAKNDAKVEENETIQLRIIPSLNQPPDSGCVPALPVYYVGANNAGAVTIIDDDHWQVSVQAVDDIALEPCGSVSEADKMGYYSIYREPISGKNATDLSYPIIVEFKMEGTATLFSPNGSVDYTLGCESAWQNAFGEIYGRATIPANETTVNVSLRALIDLFNEEKPQIYSLIRSEEMLKETKNVITAEVFYSKDAVPKKEDIHTIRVSNITPKINFTLADISIKHGKVISVYAAHVDNMLFVAGYFIAPFQGENLPFSFWRKCNF